MNEKHTSTKAMSGEESLQRLLKNMSPVLDNQDYVFVSLAGIYQDYAYLDPICSFQEREGLTLIIPHGKAIEHNMNADSVFKRITLEVHSSLHAVGLTAAVSSKLAGKGISANVVAGYYHDHIFVQAEKADVALQSLLEIAL